MKLIRYLSELKIASSSYLVSPSPDGLITNLEEMLNSLASLYLPTAFQHSGILLCFESVRPRFQSAHRSSIFKTIGVSPPAPSALPGPHLASSSPEDEKIKVVFLSTTRARTCYGCGGSIRSKDDVSMRLVPPVPYDIVLTRKERRVFKERGSNRIRIAKTDENVYYHPKRTCLLEKVSNVSPGMFTIDESVETNLTESHKNLLNGQFRLGIR